MLFSRETALYAASDTPQHSSWYHIHKLHTLRKTVHSSMHTVAMLFAGWLVERARKSMHPGESTKIMKSAVLYLLVQPTNQPTNQPAMTPLHLPMPRKANSVNGISIAISFSAHTATIQIAVQGRLQLNGCMK